LSPLAGLLASHPAAALESVSLQLKWKHQFQFAGHYAALEQGFYRDAGLDVTIREAVPMSTSPRRLPAVKRFRVCSANVLREWTMGRRMVVLAVIFQRSPAYSGSAPGGYRSVSDLRGRTLMDTPAAMRSPRC